MRLRAPHQIGRARRRTKDEHFARIHVPRTRIERLVAGHTGVSADTAMRLARVFGTTPEYWMNLRRAWDLAQARQSVDVSDIEPLAAA
ncbi:MULTISPECIES: HigA family addiction module antitoxin [unclassified Roseitalea]|uniref:HigA family addiction module antitoxin n=1 Tax=unclassified Roseitalea TaxID=2639107 RepID=UPI00273E2806|nr:MULTISPECIES: HigA family addiction module antitoxin [unclassified Roseitalea]